MRALRISLIAAAVLVGLFVAADRVVVHLVQDKAAQSIEDSQDVASASVSIDGFPFLTQVFVQELDDVTVEMDDLTAKAGDKDIVISKVTAHLTDVHFNSDYSSATADEATGTAKLSYKDLNTLAPNGVKISYPGKERASRNQVEITASIDVLGQTFEIPQPIYSTVKVTKDNGLKLEADKIPGEGLIPGSEGKIREAVNIETDLDGLPKGLMLDKAEVTKEGIVFSLSGKNVELMG